MSFTTPCFIRKNTLELRKKLEELGYEPSYPIFGYPEVFKHIATYNFFGSKYYGVSDDEISHHGEIKDAIKNRKMIDCGTNEELFLALVAMRDDTDSDQWFICIKDLETAFESFYKGDFILCKINKFPKSEEGYFRKATVEEIIEHFK